MHIVRASIRQFEDGSFVKGTKTDGVVMFILNEIIEDDGKQRGRQTIMTTPVEVFCTVVLNYGNYLDFDGGDIMLKHPETFRESKSKLIPNVVCLLNTPLFNYKLIMN